MINKQFQSTLLAFSLTVSSCILVAPSGSAAPKAVTNKVTNVRKTSKQISAEDLILNKARAYGTHKQFKEAERCYLSVLSKNPKNYDVRRELAFLLSYQPSRRQDALQQFAQVLKAKPNDVSAHFGRSMTLAWMGDYTKSQAELHGILAKQPKSVLDVNDEGRKKLPVKLAYAEILAWGGNADESEKAYEAYLATNPQDYRARLDLALLLRNAPEKREQAIAEFDKVLATDPGNQQALFGKGLTLAWTRQYDHALEILKPLAAQSPTLELVSDKLPVQRAVAEVLGWSGDITDATAAYKSYLASFPNDDIAHLEYAEALSYLSSSRNAAIAEFDQILQKNPENKTARFERAMTYAYNHRFAEAVSEMNHLAATNLLVPTIDTENNKGIRESMPIGLALAQTLSASGDLSGCEQACKNYLVLVPNDLRAQKCLGEVLSYQPTRRVEAVAIFSKILDKNPDDRTARLDLLNTLVWMGDKSKANEQLAVLKVASIDGATNNDDSDSHKQMGANELFVGNADAALNDFKIALAKNGDRKDPEIIDGIGQSCIALNRPQEAEAAYREGISNLPQEGRFYTGLAQAYAMQGKTTDAVAELNKGLQGHVSIAAATDLIDIFSSSESYAPLTSALCDWILKSEPSNKRALRTLGQMLADEVETRPQGIEYLRKYVHLEPQDNEAKENLASVLSWEGDTRKESLAVYRELIQKQPNNLNLLASYAEVLSWSNKLGEAMKDFHFILTQDPGHRNSLLCLGRCHNWCGDYLKADKVLAAASDRYPHDFEITLARAINYRDLGRIDRARQLLRETSGTKLSAR